MTNEFILFDRLEKIKDTINKYGEELYILESVNPDVAAENHLDGNIVFMLA